MVGHTASMPTHNSCRCLEGLSTLTLRAHYNVITVLLLVLQVDIGCIAHCRDRPTLALHFIGVKCKAARSIEKQNGKQQRGAVVIRATGTA
jgi:hypothetical protein